MMNNTNINIKTYASISHSDVYEIITDDTINIMKDYILFLNKDSSEHDSMYCLTGIKKHQGEIYFVGQHKLADHHNTRYFEVCKKQIDIPTSLTFENLKTTNKIDSTYYWIAMDGNGCCWIYNSKPRWNPFSKEWCVSVGENNGKRWPFDNYIDRQMAHESLIKITDYI